MIYQYNKKMYIAKFLIIIMNCWRLTPNKDSVS